MRNRYLKIFLASSLLCSPLFGSSSLNAMKQSYSISPQYELKYGIDYIKKNYNMKIYTSYVPEKEFASLYKDLNWKLYSEKLIDELKKHPIDRKFPLFFLITCDDSPLAIGIIREDTCLRMIIKSELIDGIDKQYIDKFIKENYHFILQNPPPTEKSLQISKAERLSIIDKKSDRKPILQSEHQNDNNFSIVGKSKPVWQELTYENANWYIEGKKNSQKPLQVSSKNTEISIIREKSDQKPILQTEFQNANNFSILSKSKPGWQKLEAKNENNLYIEGEKNSREKTIGNKYTTNSVYSKPIPKYQNKKIISKNNNSKKYPVISDMYNSFNYRNIKKGSKNLYLIRNSNMINSRKNYNLNNLDLQKTIENYNSNENKYPNLNYKINTEKLENSTLNNESSKYNNTYKLYPNEYPKKNITATTSVKKYTKESFYKYPQNFRKETLNAKSHRITANKYTTEIIKEKLSEDKEYNDLIQEQKKLMQQLVDSKESNRVKNNPGEYGLRYINPELVKVPEDYEMPEKEKYEIPDKIGNNITENNIGMRRKLYSQDENNPARIYNQKLNNFSLKKDINFIGLYNALTRHDLINLGQGDTYRLAMDNKPLENFDFIKGEVIKK